MAMGMGSQRRMRGGVKLKAPKRPGLDMPVEEMWQRLAKAISEIQNHNISKLSYEEHYRYAYNLVLHKHGDTLYQGVQQLVTSHLAKVCTQDIVSAFPPGGAAPAANSVILLPSATAYTSSTKKKASTSSATMDLTGDGETNEADGVVAPGQALAGLGASDSTDAVAKAQAGERLLKAIKDAWDDHCTCMSKLKDVLKYVDRVYVSSARVPLIWDLGLEIFRDIVVRSPKHPIHQYLLVALLAQVQIERSGSVINRSVLKSNIEMLLTLTDGRTQKSVYKTDFEPSFLATSAEYYKAEAARMMDTSDMPAYLSHVERRLADEAERAQVFLSPELTEKSLRELLECHLLTTHLDAIVQSPAGGLVNMLDAERLVDLARMHRLFGRVVGGLDTMKKGVKEYIFTKGKQINEQALLGTTGGPTVAAQRAASAAEAATDAVGAGQDAPSSHMPTAAAGPDDEAGVTDAKSKGKTKERPGASGPTVTGAAAMALRWVQDVLDFKDKFDGILVKAWGGDRGCQTAINEAFESFINQNQRAPEFISLFIDENLKKGLKGKTEEEVDVVLDKTITLFRYLTEKDAFERYYKNHLARRLIQGRSVSDDAERGMMAKLKVECGHGYITKLQGMLNDMKISADTMSAWKECLDRSEKPAIDLSVSVLTSTFWPMHLTAVPCTLAPEMVDACKSFERFYFSRHSGRRLTWHPNHGNADVKATFKGRRHELNVSTYALVILLLFNDVAEGESLSYEDIKRVTDIPDGELQRTLQSLACAKYKILTKTPKGRDINPNDRFAFNENFSAPMTRIKIATVAARVENADERKETEEKIEEARKNQIEACIVRVMKDRKTMSHNELVNEVTHQLASRFQPHPPLIKKRIESLIDREYLERAEAKSVYNYLA